MYVIMTGLRVMATMSQRTVMMRQCTDNWTLKTSPLLISPKVQDSVSNHGMCNYTLWNGITGKIVIHGLNILLSQFPIVCYFLKHATFTLETSHGMLNLLLDESQSPQNWASLAHKVTGHFSIVFALNKSDILLYYWYLS